MPRFRLLAGMHVQDDPHRMECDTCKHRWNSVKASHTRAPREECPACLKVTPPRIATNTRFRDKVYRCTMDHKAGTITCDVFDSRSDLTKMNAPGFSPKFELVPPGTPLYCSADGPPPASEEATSPYQPGNSVADTVRSMNLEELKKYAAEEEIDLTKCKNKDEMVKVILGTAVKV